MAFVRHTGPYNECGAAWEKLCSWAEAKGLFGPNTQLLGLCYDDPEVTPPEKIRYDACLTIDTDVRPEGEVGVQEIPGGRYAVTLHQGAFGETGRYLCHAVRPMDAVFRRRNERITQCRSLSE